MFNAYRRIVCFALFTGLFFMVSCSDAPPVKEGGRTYDSLGPCDWVDNPGAIRDHLAAVGAMGFMGNLQQARDSAQANGRAQLAATLKAQIQQLIEDWAKTAGDLNRAKTTLTALVNNESFTRQFVDTVVKGTRAMKFCPPASQKLEIGETIFALMVLEDPVKWQNNVDNEMENELLRDEILWKTEALKSAARDRMDNLKKDHETRRVEQQQAVQKMVPTPPSTTPPAPTPTQG